MHANNNTYHSSPQCLCQPGHRARKAGRCGSNNSPQCLCGPRPRVQAAGRCGSMWWFLWLLCLLTACKKDFLDDQFLDDQLVMLSEITAGDSVKIPIGKTIKVQGGALIRFEKVNDATVTLTEANNLSWVLKPSFSQQYGNNPTTVYTNRKRFKSNTAYTIEVKHPTLGVLKASTFIPALPKVNFKDTATEVYQGKTLLAADITWQDEDGKDDYYIVEAVKELLRIGHHFFYQGIFYDYETTQGKKLYDQVKNSGVKLYTDTLSQNQFLRLHLYTEDGNADNSHIDNYSNSFRRLFFTDKTFSGQSYTTRVYIDPQFFVSASQAQKGRVKLQFKQVSKELYDYLLIYEKYKTDLGALPAGQLASPPGNIKNGLGIFGGSARREKLFYFDVLY
jgi:hypothetical protein